MINLAENHSMNLSFTRIYAGEINKVLPFIQQLSMNKFTDAVLRERFVEMLEQPYECYTLYNDQELIGVFGLWFLTKHYAGKVCEPDHIIIKDAYRNKGVGKMLFDWIANYAKTKGCEAAEVNSYVTNHPSHKFYLNNGYHIIGYHFMQFF